MYRAEAPRPSSVDSFPEMKEKFSSSVIKTARQSRTVIRGGWNGTGVGSGLEPSAKAEDVMDATRADSGALRSKAGSAYHALEVAMIEFVMQLSVGLKTCVSRRWAVLSSES